MLGGAEVIQSWKSESAKAIFEGRNPGKGFPADLVRVTRRRLQQLDNASELIDLRSPPSNRLEKLSGDREGQHSIRVNMQFRICFVWTARGPEQVEFVDYH
jgi:proteic killer suppression protein